MKNLCKIIILLLLVLIIIMYKENKSKEIIVYGWDEKYIDIEKFNDYNITTLYQEYSKEFLLNNGTLKFENTYFLCGDPSWGIDKTSDAFEFVDLVYNYNKKAKTKFKGIVFDIESYSSKKFIDYKEYEKNLISIYKYAKSKGLYTVMVIPYWLDGDILENIIKNGSDRISLMNYNMDEAYNNMKIHYEYAKKYDKEIDCIFELYNGYDNVMSEYKKYFFMDVNLAFHETKDLK